MKDIGKIIRILDDNRVIVDLGKEDLVEEGMKFIIFEESDRIEDPETGENLGTIEIIKHRIKAISVQEKMSIMESDEYTKSPTIGNLATMMAQQYQYHKIPLNIDEEQVKPLPQINYKIYEGDKVKKSRSQSQAK